MTIICNNCVGGRIYQQLNLQYNNQFIWSRIYYDSYKKLICNFDNIDFKNIVFDNSYIKDSCKNHIIIDNLIEVNYPHYIQNSKFNIPTKQNNNIDIYYNDIKSYTINKYLNRYNRLNKDDIRIYILVDIPPENLTDKDIKDFLKLKVNGIKILVTNNLLYKSRSTYIYNTEEINTANIAKELINKYPEIFHE